MNPPNRPVLRWFGGKWRLAPWIISHFPPHDIYTEPFGGAASVLLQKRPADQEIYNDLFSEVVTLFSVLRSSRAEELINKVALTPFSRVEFEKAHTIDDDDVELARHLIIRSFFGHGGSDAILRKTTSFRARNEKKGNAAVRSWPLYPPILGQAVERLRHVVIENRDALELIQTHDSARTLHYIDPPYLHSTRTKQNADGVPYHGYAHEFTDQQHRDLLAIIEAVRGKVILSGYPSELYDSHLADWHRVQLRARDEAASERTEVLWMNFDPQQFADADGLWSWSEGQS